MIMTQKPVLVSLIEDSSEYREVVTLAIESQSDINLVSQFGTVEIALRSYCDPSHPRPDVILLDLRLPGIDGLDAIEMISRVLPDAHVIILTQSNQEADVLRAISLGAVGYLLKSTTLNQLTDGIRSVISGGAPIESSVATYLLKSLQGKNTIPIQPNGRAALSDREVQILKLLAEGHVKKEIAKSLGIGYTTVDTHVSRIYGKLKVNNAPAAVDRAHRLGILSETQG